MAEAFANAYVAISESVLATDTGNAFSSVGKKFQLHLTVNRSEALVGPEGRHNNNAESFNAWQEHSKKGALRSAGAEGQSNAMKKSKVLRFSAPSLQAAMRAAWGSIGIDRLPCNRDEILGARELVRIIGGLSCGAALVLLEAAFIYTKPGAEALIGAVLLGVTLWQFNVRRKLAWVGRAQAERLLEASTEFAEVGAYVQATAAAYRRLTLREARMLAKYVKKNRRYPL